MAFQGKNYVRFALAATLLLTIAVPVMANSREENCRRHVEKAEFKLQKAIRKHGEHSRQAENHRRKLAEIESRCNMRH